LYVQLILPFRLDFLKILHVQKWIRLFLKELKFCSFTYCHMEIYIFFCRFGGHRCHGSWIYNYLCNQCQSPLTLWVWTPLRRGVLNTTLCDKVFQLLMACLWFSLSTPVSSINTTDRYDITEILLKVVLSTIKPTNQSCQFD
jgi:hypothetical protein